MMNPSLSIFLALLAVIVTTGALWFSHREIAPPKATWDDVLNEAKQDHYRLISTDELWKRYRKAPGSFTLDEWILFLSSK
jgi:hypothetical protein